MLEVFMPTKFTQKYAISYHNLAIACLSMLPSGAGEAMHQVLAEWEIAIASDGQCALCGSEDNTLNF